MSEDLHDSVNNFRKWQNNPDEIYEARVKSVQDRLRNHQNRAKPLDLSVLVLTPFDQKLLHGMKVSV